MVWPEADRLLRRPPVAEVCSFLSTCGGTRGVAAPPSKINRQKCAPSGPKIRRSDLEAKTCAWIEPLSLVLTGVFMNFSEVHKDVAGFLLMICLHFFQFLLTSLNVAILGFGFLLKSLNVSALSISVLLKSLNPTPPLLGFGGAMASAMTFRVQRLGPKFRIRGTEQGMM